MVSFIKLTVVVAAAIMLFPDVSGESIHVKGMQAGPVDAFLTRDNVIKNPSPISTQKSDREDRG